jgi:hypothetical protein
LDNNGNPIEVLDLSGPEHDQPPAIQFHDLSISMETFLDCLLKEINMTWATFHKNPSQQLPVIDLDQRRAFRSAMREITILVLQLDQPANSHADLLLDRFSQITALQEAITKPDWWTLHAPKLALAGWVPTHLLGPSALQNQIQYHQQAILHGTSK